MSQIFLSHSVRDKEQVDRLIDFLVLGMGIPQEEIFCTSKNGGLTTGSSFIEEIRSAMRQSPQVLLLITENYRKSPFCMAELGAAWALQDSGVLPLLVPPVRYDDLRRTPLNGLQMRMQNREEDLTALYDELCRKHIAKVGRTVEFNAQLRKYLAESGKPAPYGEGQLIRRDGRGYYHARIGEVRPVPGSFRCYRIEGRIDCGEPPVNGETHWLFYQVGMYEDLAVGDEVEFSISSTRLRQFNDLKNARNLYPAELRKLG